MIGALKKPPTAFAASISRAKRSRNVLSSASCGCTSLIAASLPLGNLPTNTVPIPPWPNRPSKVNGPMQRGSLAPSGFTVRGSLEDGGDVGLASRIFHCDSNNLVGGETCLRLPEQIGAVGDPFVDLLAASVPADYHKS